MQIKATANFEEVSGKLTGAIVLTVEWAPDSEHENILLHHLLSDSAHENADVTSANFGTKFISTMKLHEEGRLSSAREEMALYSEWKRVGGNYPEAGGKAVSFEEFKTLKANEDSLDTELAKADVIPEE